MTPAAKNRLFSRRARQSHMFLLSPRMHVITLDQGLAAAGVILALFSLAFAAFMVSQYDRHPGFEGGEDSRFLPRPSLALPASAQARVKLFRRSAIDFNPAGSIIPFKPGHKMRWPKTNQNNFITHQPGTGFELSFVHNNMALVKHRRGFYAARVGTVLPDAGSVLSIERRGRNWILVTEKAVIAGSK